MPDAYLMRCENPACAWQDDIGEALIHPETRDRLVCPQCGHEVAFVEDEEHPEAP